MRVRSLGATARRAMCASALVAASACFGPPPEPPPLESAELVLPGFDSARVVLEDGSAEIVEDGAVVWSAGLSEWIVRHDVDGDGDEDVLAVTFGTGGGSGVFYDLTLFTLERSGARDAGRWLWRSSSALGDRVRVRALTLGGSTVELLLIEHGPDDPQCCPSVTVTRSWRIEDGAVGLTALDPSPATGDAP